MDHAFELRVYKEDAYEFEVSPEGGPRCKFRSRINCDFCAFHSDCEEHWKGGDKVICDKCKYLIDSVDEVGTPMGSFPVHTRRCKKHETCGGEWCDKYEMKEGESE